MVLIAVTGRLGAGKTAYIVREAYHYATKGYYIATNFHLEGIGHKQLKKPEDIIYLGLNDKIGKKAIFLDEGYLWFDALTKSSKKQQFYRNLINITRKMGMVIFFTSQTIGQIYYRARLLFDYIIEPTMYRDKYDNIKGMSYSIMLPDKFSGFYFGQKMYIKNIARYFKYYDTNEIINDFIKEYTPQKELDVTLNGVQTMLEFAEV